MDFIQDAPVRSATGGRVGHVDRVVIDPKTDEVTHIVVRKGLVFTEDKVIPVSLIASATAQGVLLRQDVGDVQQLPPYQESHYIPADSPADLPPSRDTDPQRTRTHIALPVYAYPPFDVPFFNDRYGYGLGMPPDLMVETTTNIPKDEIALKEGAYVISRDNQHVGNIEQVLTDTSTNRTTHFIMSHGRLFKTRKLIPMQWVADLKEDQVRLAVTVAALEHARDYEQQR